MFGKQSILDLRLGNLPKSFPNTPGEGFFMEPAQDGQSGRFTIEAQDDQGGVPPILLTRGNFRYYEEKIQAQKAAEVMVDFIRCDDQTPVNHAD